ncbi:MAG: hypothetical protein JXR10_09365 [Cyclobacteriaceae bacterium]
MKRLLLHIFSLLLATYALAQTDSLMIQADTVVVSAADTLAFDESEVPQKAKFVRPEVSFDYGKGALTALNIEKRLEAGLALVFFDHYYLIAEAGTADLQPRTAITNGSYSSAGDYFRAGGGYQGEITANSRLGFGARYALCQYEDEGVGRFTSTSGVQSDPTTQFKRTNLEARWVELVLHSESDLRLNRSNPQARINRLFSLGFHLRMRFLATYDRFSDNEIFAIPGYGRTSNTPNLALNLYIKFNPFR